MESSNLAASGGGAAPAPRPVIMVRGRVYEPAVGPKLRVLLFVVFAFFALLGATGAYMLIVRKFELNTYFSILMFGVHDLAGVAIIIPFLVFGLIHYLKSRHRKNRLAVKLGVILFFTGIGVIATGVALLQIDVLPQLPTTSFTRMLVLFLHAATPVAAVVIYVMHRRAGPDIQWKWGISWAAGVVAFVAVMVLMHSHDPNRQSAKGSIEGETYFEPSAARTTNAEFIPEHLLMADKYCMKCHADIYNDHLHSAHKLSSFNNPAYLFSVRETRRRSGVRASRWCAGCHDPVPFFTGRFDNENFDDVNDSTAHAGITCTSCHSITHVASRSGNADYTISAPIHYPFAFSENPALQWFSNQLIKAKPDFHKKTFMKPLHRNEAFCSTCHKVGIPQEVNHYKEFLRGQDHPTSHFLSGVGHGARSFYYPKTAMNRCSDCHMPLNRSDDFASRDFDESGERKRHNHLSLGANTAIVKLAKDPKQDDIIKAQTDFLRGGFDGKSPPLRIDLFGVKLVRVDQVGGLSALFGLGSAGGPGSAVAALVIDQIEEKGVEAPLIADKPLRPDLPELVPGNSYQFEVVVRTLNMGHHFTQGTTDSNEVWVDFQAKSGNRVLGRSGAMDGGEEDGRVDPWAHFINVFLLDRHGNRIDRRNPQDIFTRLYDHQIPPGAASVLHYRLDVPRDLKPDEPIEISVRVRYRKFDYTYMEIVYGEGKVPKLPVIDMCDDKVILPVTGIAAKVPAQESPIQPVWQRWNDYGIGCFLEGGPSGKDGGERGAAAMAFSRLLAPEFAEAKAAHSHGHLNMARVHLSYGLLAQARESLAQASKCDPPAPWWTVAWFNGLVNMEFSQFDAAIADFEKILLPVAKHTDNIRAELSKRKFDFSQDYVVINKLGEAFFGRAQEEESVFFASKDPKDKALRDQFLRRAIAQFETTLEIDAEDTTAHNFLEKCYQKLAPNQAGGGPQTLRFNEAEKKLIDVADRLSGPLAIGPGALDAAQRLSRMVIGESEEVRLHILLKVRDQARRLAQTTDDEWLRLAVTPAIHAIDRRLLKEAIPLAQSFAGKGKSAAADGALLGELLDQLSQRPRLGNVRTSFLALTAWPLPALPVNNALATLADRDVLGGGLPPTRLLTLIKTHQLIHSVKDNAETAHEAARILARLHMMFHAIYKPDESAQGHAIGIARQRYPAGNRASQSIVLYNLRPETK